MRRFAIVLALGALLAVPSYIARADGLNRATSWLRTAIEGRNQIAQASSCGQKCQDALANCRRGSAGTPTYMACQGLYNNCMRNCDLHPQR